MIDENSAWDWNFSNAINKPLMSYDFEKQVMMSKSKTLLTLQSKKKSKQLLTFSIQLKSKRMWLEQVRDLKELEFFQQDFMIMKWLVMMKSHQMEN